MPQESVQLMTSASMAAFTLMSGIMLAVVPWLVCRREAFAVTVPESAQADPRLARMRRTYLAATLAITLLCSAGALFVPADQVIASSALVCAPMMLGFILMLVFRSRVQAIKRAAGWRARKGTSAAVLERAGFEAPRSLPLAWSLVYAPIILATLALTLAVYPAMPQMVPMHMNAAGQIDSWVEKGWQVMLSPAAIQQFTALCLTASHWMMLRSKRPTSTETPVASALAYGMFARAQSVALLVTGCLVLVAIALMPLTFASMLTLHQAAAIVIVVCILVLTGQLILSAVFGQAGSRLLRRMGPAGELDFDDDERWRAGVFYVDREDPAIVVPKRFGIGWSLNYGNPRSWAALALFAIITVTFIILITKIAG